MREDKSTPRPWHIYQPEEGGETDVFKHGRTIAARIKGATMAVAYTDYGTPELAEANAALIVSAVNSHDAMKECVEALRSSRCPGGGWNGMPEDTEPTVANCMAAKACGCDCGDALAKLEKANTVSEGSL